MTVARRPRRPRAVGVALVAASAAVGLAACTGPDATTAAEQTLTVFAAASLTEAFEQIAANFEAEHDVDVRLSVAGSSTLVAQIEQGAPADVVATADTDTMARLVADDLVAAPRSFATNTLEIAVPPGNPADITSLAGLAEPAVNLVTCAPEVPCGAATTAVVDHAGLTLHPASEEQSVTDVLGKVTSGEADAGLVYVTDVARAGDQVEGITFAESDAAVNTYPIATVADTDRTDLARQFVDAVLAPDGQAVLADRGFAGP